MYSIIDNNPTFMYLESLKHLYSIGDELSPRGKRIKEIRPAAFEFEYPYNRVTFLANRRINPFFQIAESLWILSGRADVEWLLQFNANMGQFSDDGKYFNAPYGERMRSWNKNSLHNIIINPIDQLMDAYVKLVEDKDTRQAVISLYNPMFDNANYTIKEHGKDICCNLIMTFKIRQDRLHLTVFNRSNDIHWGLFGANLCQFSTIQEVMLNWLRKSGKPEYEKLEIGTYTQLTDSLHMYLDDYGSKITGEILDYYTLRDSTEALVYLTMKDEPRMSLGHEEFSTFLTTYWGVIDPYLTDDEFIVDDTQRDEVFGESGLVSDLHSKGVIDDYWYFGIQSMVAYRLAKLGHIDKCLQFMYQMKDCQWKVSMLYFLKPFIQKSEGTVYQAATSCYQFQVNSLVNNLKFTSESKILNDYLRF